MNKIEVKDYTDNSKAFYFGKILLGVAVKFEDGFYHFKFSDNDGYLSAYTLRWIAERLDELNKEWSDYIAANLKP